MASPASSLCLLALIPSCYVSVTQAVATLANCNHARNFDVVKGAQPELVCAGLSSRSSVQWTITPPTGAQEVTVAECKACGGICPACSNTQPQSYTASRPALVQSKLKFLDSSKIVPGSTVKCTDTASKSSSTCRLFVTDAYKLPACSNNVLQLKENPPTPVQCTGMMGAQNMFWTITYPSGVSTTLATCGACTKAGKCPPCKVNDNDFAVVRQASFSTLTIKNNGLAKSGATLKCSKKDQVTHASCKVVIL